MTAMATYVGFDPRREAKLIQPPSKEAIQLFADGKLDALLGLPAGAAGAADKKRSVMWS